MKLRKMYPGKICFRMIVLVISVGVYQNITAQNPNIKCYFNHPVNNAISTGSNAVYLNNTFPDTIAAYINRARFTVDIALYNYTANAARGAIAIVGGVIVLAARGKKSS